MAVDIRIAPFAVTGATDDDTSIYALVAPSAALGGGLTIVDAYAIDDTATGAGTSWAVALHKYSALGTPAVNGTIAAAVGGTASPFAAGVPQQFTLDTDYTFLNAGEWLVIEKTEDNSSDPQVGYVIVHYYIGR
jgi:hypothetical protein